MKDECPRDLFYSIVYYIGYFKTCYEDRSMLSVLITKIKIIRGQEEAFGVIDVRGHGDGFKGVYLSPNSSSGIH